MSDAIQTQGTRVQRGDGGSPEAFSDIGEVVSFNGPTGSASEIDVTHLGSVAKEYLIGLADEGQIPLELNWVPSNTQQIGLRSDRANRTKRNFKIIFTDTGVTTASFAAFVMGFSLSVAPDSKVSASVTLRITGAIVWT